MTCFTPLRLWAKKGGGATASQRDRDPGAPDVLAACRCCAGCILSHRRQWGVRNVLERQMHEAASFVTLTLSDEHYPSDGSVVVRPLQLFMKRLRKAVPSVPISYFGCGEYGSQSWRAHYHVLLHGYDFSADRFLWRQSSRGDATYRSPLLEKVWPYGHAEIGALTLQSAQYVAGYTAKKALKLVEVIDDDAFYMREHPVSGRAVLLKPEFITMSTRPAIGLRWLNRFQSDVFPSGFVVVNGVKYAAPKFFERRLGERFEAAALAAGLTDETLHHDPDWLRFQEMKEEREQAQVERMRANPEEFTPLRIAQRHEHAYLTRLARLSRDGVQ